MDAGDSLGYSLGTLYWCAWGAVGDAYGDQYMSVYEYMYGRSCKQYLNNLNIEYKLANLLGFVRCSFHMYMFWPLIAHAC